MTQYFFTPPTEQTVPPVSVEGTGLGNRLMRYFQARPRGKTVWKIDVSTYTFDQPYPTVPDDPRTTEAEGANNNIAATFTKVFLGGRTYEISADEYLTLATFLFNNGYTATDWLEFV